MGRALIRRIHNPRNHSCTCDRDCWCNRTAVGRLVKWWFPARRFGINRRNTRVGSMTPEERRAWKRDRGDDMLRCEVQPRYERIVRLGPDRFGITVRQDDGTLAVHELGRLGRCARPS